LLASVCLASVFFAFFSPSHLEARLDWGIRLRQITFKTT